MRKVQGYIRYKMEVIILASVEYTLILAASTIEKIRRQRILKRFLAGSLTYEELLKLKKTIWFRKLYKEPPKVDTAKKDD